MVILHQKTEALVHNFTVFSVRLQNNLTSVRQHSFSCVPFCVISEICHACDAALSLNSCCAVEQLCHVTVVFVMSCCGVLLCSSLLQMSIFVVVLVWCVLCCSILCCYCAILFCCDLYCCVVCYGIVFLF